MMDLVPAPPTLELSANAIYFSVAINPTDVTNDPLHYHLGMWGKLIILGVIHKQGRKQKVDPERNPEYLNWAQIFREMIQRTPMLMQRLLSVGACQSWYENRLRIYEDAFPEYRLHESAIDQLMRHYALQLMTLQECATASGVSWSIYYWENFHEDPGIVDTPLDVKCIFEALRQTNSNSQLKFLSSAFCTVGIKKTCSDFLLMNDSKEDTEPETPNSDISDCGDPFEKDSRLIPSAVTARIANIGSEIMDAESLNKPEADAKIDGSAFDDCESSVSTLLSSDAEEAWDTDNSTLTGRKSLSPSSSLRSTPEKRNQSVSDEETLPAVSIFGDYVSTEGSSNAEVSVALPDTMIVENKEYSSQSGSTKTNVTLPEKAENSASPNASSSHQDSALAPCHVVIEHGKLPQSFPVKSTPTKRKRSDSDEDGRPPVPNFPNEQFANKRPRNQGQEKLNMKPLLLSVLHKLRDGQGLLYEMSELVRKKTAKHGGCEYTLRAIEDKIFNGEIKDVESIVNSCRCLVMLFMLSEGKRVVSNQAFEVLKKLRAFNLQE